MGADEQSGAETTSPQGSGGQAAPTPEPESRSEASALDARAPDVGAPAAGEGAKEEPAGAPAESPAGPPAGDAAEAAPGASAEAREAEAEAPAGTETEAPAGTPERVPEIAERPRKGYAAPGLIPIDRIDDDRTFQLREEGDLSLLATDLARLGQLFPVDLRFRPPDRFQIVCGFRRVAALRFLQRDKVLARVHMDLSDEDALLMALAAAIHGAPVSTEELTAVREQLESGGRLEGAARDMLDKALSSGEELAPESTEEEIDADELADDVAVRLGEINQDLSLLADVFNALDDTRKDELLKQLRYSAELVAFLEGSG